MLRRDSAPGRTSNRFLLRPLISVGSFGKTRNEADTAAWNADNRLISLWPCDIITLPDGSTAGGWVDCHQPPAWDGYRDPDVKRYVGRYTPFLRFS